MKTAAGFTLIEMMAAVAVVAVVTALAIPNMRVFVSNAHIRGTAEEIRSGLNLARSEAIRRNAVVTFALNGNGWDVFVPGGNEDGTDLTIVSRAPKQTVMSVDADLAQIQFSGAGWPTPFGSTMTVNITDETTGECRPTGGVDCRTVLVAAGGLVRSCDPAAAAGSATACN
jgi:type IV fimbrial biogenesis protein FimT